MSETALARPRKTRLQDLTGMKFNMLRVIDRSEVCRKKNVPLWNVMCDCGQPSLVRGEYLRYNHTKSCGCDVRRGQLESHLIHGMSQSNAHSIWRKIIQRCEWEKDKTFKYYGGRGIKMCDRWRNGEGSMNGFQCFYQDMGDRPSVGHSIDRINNSEGYSPENCRWATRSEQARNTRRNIVFEWKGKKMVLIDICRMESVPYARVLTRVRDLGWGIQKAVTEPPKWIKKS